MLLSSGNLVISSNCEFLVPKTGFQSLHSPELQVCPSPALCPPTQTFVCLSPPTADSLSGEAWLSCLALYWIWLGSSVRLSLNTLNHTQFYNFFHSSAKGCDCTCVSICLVIFWFNLLEMTMVFIKKNYQIQKEWYRKNVGPREMGSLLWYYLLGMSKLDP